ncbi:hypothetical protein N9917_01345 [Deltaproteobacteria bacterium]|nr:hypothetical protein [Deltaproteobacteria bacterium]
MSLADSIGKVVVTPGERKLHIAVDPAIMDYARAMVPPIHKVRLNRPRYAPHITVIRDEEWECNPKLDGTEVQFSYDPCVVPGKVYWWLRVWSADLLRLRTGEGLPELSDLCRPPDMEECFHITIGNTKGR